jgi:hypothetical protein
MRSSRRGFVPGAIAVSAGAVPSALAVEAARPDASEIVINRIVG